MPNRRPANSCTRVSSIVSVMVLIAAIPPGRGPPDDDLGSSTLEGQRGRAHRATDPSLTRVDGSDYPCRRLSRSCSKAYAVAAARVARPHLTKMFDRCRATVL